MSSIATDRVLASKIEPAGLTLVAIIVVLAMANFLAILDITIVNVLVPHIAGTLAVSSSDGTWVITAYAVAEAIMVPLTGWLAERFGTVRVFLWAMAGFGLFSLLCGLSPTLGVIVAHGKWRWACATSSAPWTSVCAMTLPAKRATFSSLNTASTQRPRATQARK